MSQRYDRLVAKLRELFQLDQPELDFGIYRILHADLIYINGGNNLENLKSVDDRWKVRLIEEEFFRLMFDVEDV